MIGEAEDEVIAAGSGRTVRHRPFARGEACWRETSWRDTAWRETCSRDAGRCRVRWHNHNAGSNAGRRRYQDGRAQ